MASLGSQNYRSTVASNTSLLTPANSQDANLSPTSANSIRSVASDASLNDSRYGSIRRSYGPTIPPSISDKFAMSADPSSWGGDFARQEPDDFLHNPDPKRDRKYDQGGTICTARGIMNLGCIFIIAAGMLTLFAGYPIISYFTKKPLSTNGGFNIGGINATGQVASISGLRALIDSDTPEELRTKVNYMDDKEWQLIFSDEFNVEGRSFYPGDDPYWEAVNLHYWQTNNLEWYDPAAVTTRNGSLEITLSKQETHGLDYQGGMISSWNKFCFTGGVVEASVVLPGINNVMGLWPAVWMMGNLGRAGYGASLDGMWPYTYDSCDVGTTANQTLNGLPLAATENGDPSHDNVLSFLVGQRLSRCTCTGESHPGPVHADGTYVGRAAPEIDLFEATVSGSPLTGQVSQSGQWAPFNAKYLWNNITDNYDIPNATLTYLNDYKGGAYQQTSSALTYTDPESYELTGNQYSVYGVQYQPGFDSAYISWIAGGQVAWTLYAAGMGADSSTEISARPIPQEPMYLMANLGISENFGWVDVDHLTFPTTMKIDYIRVYQDPDNINIGCDPSDFPTAAYINQYAEAYSNPNLTTWVDDYKQEIPKNSFLGQC